MDDEKWKPVKGYEGLYEVSNLGRVKSVARVVIRNDGRRRTVPEKIKKPTVAEPGYPVVGLNSNRTGRSVGKVHRVHVLVADAFIPNPDNLPIVRHLNDVKTDNRLENLERGTHKQNQADKYRNGYTPDRPDFCKRGHRLSKDNTYVKPDGRRNCITCGRAYGKILYKFGEVTEDLYEKYFRGDI